MSDKTYPKGGFGHWRLGSRSFLCLLILLICGLLAAWPALAQNSATADGTAASPLVADSLESPGDPVQPPASARPLWRTRTSQDEGTLIELDDVQIHGEIAQPNVAITVSRAEPLFRKIALEHVAAAGMSDLDLFRLGGRGHLPPAERIKNWKEMLNRPRQ